MQKILIKCVINEYFVQVHESGTDEWSRVERVEQHGISPEVGPLKENIILQWCELNNK